MKKFVLFTLVAPLLFGACSDYDDGLLQGRVDGLEDRIAKLEALCREMNTNISSLQTLVNTLGEKDAIESVAPIVKDGQTVGYTITFTKNEPITIYTGNDGHSPVIGIAPFEGSYYWTLDGEWMTDDAGNRIAAAGKDGSTPQLKIEEEYWWMSTDGGNTWDKLGRATGEKGEDGTDGDAFFRSVTQTDTEVIFTLADGTEIVLPKAPRLKIVLAETSCGLLADTPAQIPYTITGADGDVEFEVLSSGAVRAKALASSATEGVVSVVTADPDALDEYAKVLVFASDNRRTAMAALTFEKGMIQVAESFEATSEEQQLVIPVETNLHYEVKIEQAAQSWIRQVTTRAARVDNLVFQVDANNTGAARSATITLTVGSEVRKVVVAQEAGSEDPGPIEGIVALDKLYGYAEGTTGGEGATAANTHHFDNGDKFRQWLNLREKNKDMTPAIVYLSGTFTKDNGRGGSDASPWFDIKRTGNLTILGTDDFRMQNIGFFINDSENIIIRNVYIVMPKANNGADGISMQESHNVWVDHCTFESINQAKDYEDGSCDVTHATYNVTVSWCHFIKTQKSCLVGHSNSASADTKITVTFHHNYFDLSSSRHPRVRFGRAHVYNNFFNQVTTYGVGSAYGAMVLVEDNLFDGVRLPTDICTFPAKPSGSSWVSNLQGSVAGYLYERGNAFLNKPENATEPYPLTNVQYKAYNGEQLPTPYTYEDFKPAYGYIVDAPEQLASIVPSGAGVGKLPGYQTAPVEVNNGGITTDPDPDPGTDPDPDPSIDLGNGWTGISYGAATPSVFGSGHTLTITACGKFESGTQTFGYVYREVTGDFVATVQIDAFSPQKESNQALAGLMVTPDITAASGDLLHFMAARSLAKFYYSNRTAAAAKASKGELGAPEAVVEGASPIVRLERKGDKYLTSYSLDGGVTFGKEKSVTLAGLPETLLLGLAVNSGDSKKTSEAVFSHLTLNGETIAFSEE